MTPDRSGEFARRNEGRAAGLALELDATHHTAPAEIVVDIVTSEDELAAWQAATASGWGHDTPARRLASDRFSAVAHLTQTPGLLLARAAGCSLAVTHADTDGGSIRNLHRLGFVTTHTKTAWSRPLG